MILLISLIFIDDVIISVIIDYHCTSHIVKHAFFTLHTPHATKGRCLMIFIVFGYYSHTSAGVAIITMNITRRIQDIVGRAFASCVYM